MACDQSPGERQASDPDGAQGRAAGRPDEPALDQRKLRQRLYQRRGDGGIAAVTCFGQIRETGLEQRRQRGLAAERRWEEMMEIGVGREEAGRWHLEDAQMKTTAASGTVR